MHLYLLDAEQDSASTLVKSPPRGLIRKLLFPEILLPLLLLAAGFYVFFHATPALPGVLPFLFACLEDLFRLLQLRLLLPQVIIFRHWLL